MKYIPFLILILIIVFLVKLICQLVKNLINWFRINVFKKDTIEHERALNFMKNHVKNSLIPKWVAEEALSMLKKLYTHDDSVDTINDIMRVNSLSYIDISKKLYKEPGTDKEVLKQICINKFKKFDMNSMQKENGEMTKEDFKIYTDLVNMWYFADNSVYTQKEAMNCVTDVFASYCEEYGKQHNLYEN